ncbi:MAG: ribosome maturation factor RimM [Pseudomonadota bacterium]
MTGDQRSIVLGVVGGAHGVRGDFRVKTFTESEEDIAAYGPVTVSDREATLTLSVVRVVKPGVALVRAREVRTREQVADLTGQELTVLRSALPQTDDDDDFYIDDLIGLSAVNEDGVRVGEVAAVHDFGAGDILEIKKIPGVKGSKLVRFTKELVTSVDVVGGKVVLADNAFDEGVGEPEPSDNNASD